MTPAPRLLVAVAVGGAAGAVARHLLTTASPDDTGFPWTTFAVNVAGSLLLALLPTIALVRRSVTWTVALGPGVLGGFTTLSAYSEQTRELLDAGRSLTAASYVVGTLAACLVGVALASHLVDRTAQDAFAADGGDE